MKNYFNGDNTEGFTEAEIDMMNQAVEQVLSRWESDSDVKNAIDMVNDRFFEGCKLTDLTYTEGSRENAEAWLNGGMDDIHAGTTDKELEEIAEEAEAAARESDENWSMGKYGIDILTKHRDWKREVLRQETEEDD